MKKVVYIGGFIVAIFAFCVIVYGAWIIGKRINYSLSYEGMVKKTVQEMVKDECLIGDGNAN